MVGIMQGKSWNPNPIQRLGGILAGQTKSDQILERAARERALEDMVAKSAMQKRIMALLAPEDDVEAPSPSAVSPRPRAIGPRLEEGLDEPASTVAPMPALPSKRRFNPDRLQQVLAAAAYSGDAGATKAAEVLDKLRPQLEKGQYIDQDGRVRNRDGFVDAQSEITGATTGASEAAKAQYDVIAVPLPDGSSVQMPRGVYIQLQKSGALPELGRSQTPGAKVAAEEAARAPYDFVDATDREGRPMKVAKSSAAGGTFVGQSPAEEAKAKSDGEAADRAPQLLAQADQTLKAIDEIVNHPARKARTGKSAVLWAPPGTEYGDFDTRVEQLKGQVFLQAFNQLKGGGAITEAEGKSAQAAIARLNRAQTEDGFLTAMKDLSDVIKLGRDRVAKNLRPTARASSASTARAPSPSAGYSIVSVRRAGQ